MAIPKSQKLILSENEETTEFPAVKARKDAGPVLIREIQCLNDFVAILVLNIDTDIALLEHQKFKNEGIVVGIGPGLPDNNGSRVDTQLKLGDVVLFSERTIAQEINTTKDPYDGKKIVLIQEKSLLCKLPSIPFKVVE